MPLSKNVSRGITYVLIVVAIVVGAQLLVGSALGSSPVYVVVSKSMVPTLEIGDLVITQNTPFNDIRVGQVIIYIQPDGLGGCNGLTIVHRVVGITAQGLITQGDDRATNPVPDEPGAWPPVTANCVRGVVVSAIPYLGLVSMIIPYPWNYVLVGLILVFVFLAELRPSGEEESGEVMGSTGTAGALSVSGEVKTAARSQSRGASPRSGGSWRTTC